MSLGSLVVQFQVYCLEVNSVVDLMLLVKQISYGVEGVFVCCCCGTWLGQHW